MTTTDLTYSAPQVHKPTVYPCIPCEVFPGFLVPLPGALPLSSSDIQACNREPWALY
jgi:hypothetical protein